MDSWSTQEAREKFAVLMEGVLRGQHAQITRYGRPLAVVVPHDWYVETRKALGVEDGEQ